MPTLNDVVKDPVFQLNILLWMAQPLPRDIGIKAVLGEAGFEVHSIAPLLAPPPDVLVVLKDSGLAHQDRVRPDVVLYRKNDGRFLLTECKGGSFGPGSSTAEQARTLLVVSGPRLHEPLGLTKEEVKEGAAAYMVPSEHVDAMSETIKSLTSEMKGKKLSPGLTVLLGLESQENELFMVANKDGRNFLTLKEEKTAFIRLEPDTDPRPLYFIPYDPDCNQSIEEKAYCRRVLYERIHSAILSTAGREVPPKNIVFKIKALLNEATLGMFDLWDNRDSNKHMRRLVRELLLSMSGVLKTEGVDALEYVKDEGWKLKIPNNMTQEVIVKALSRFSCETMDLRKEPALEFEFGDQE